MLLGSQTQTLSDAGETWSRFASAGERVWYGIASSADGQTLYAQDSLGDIYRSTDGGSTWSVQFRARGSFWPLKTNADGSTFYGIRINLNGKLALFSSAMSAFTEIKDDNRLKLIYLGGAVFGVA